MWKQLIICIDDTLINTTEARNTAYQQLTFSQKELYRIHFASHPFLGFKDWIDAHHLSYSHLNELYYTYQKAFLNHADFYPGALDFIQYVKQEWHMKITLVSSSYYATLHYPILHSYDIWPWIDEWKIQDDLDLSNLSSDTCVCSSMNVPRQSCNTAFFFSFVPHGRLTFYRNDWIQYGTYKHLKRLFETMQDRQQDWELLHQILPHEKISVVAYDHWIWDGKTFQISIPLIKNVYQFEKSKTSFMTMAECISFSKTK